MTSLRNRFKEFRRKPVKRSKLDVGSKKSPKKRRPGITQSPSEPFSPPQEDDAVSFDRHNRVLIAEFKKNRRNSQVMSELMERTFQLRRKSILEESSDLKEVFKRFPFLQESDQVILFLPYTTVYSIYIFLHITAHERIGKGCRAERTHRVS